ncbi:MAG: TatD family hydrolase [Polyangiales bacterium]
MFDAHVHLDFLPAAEAAEYVRRARGAGVSGFAIPGVSPGQWANARDLAAQTQGSDWGCGIHPEYATASSADDASGLVQFAKEHRPAFIGETGLDARLEAEFPSDAQEELFMSHVALAEALELPLVVHSVRRHARVLQLLEGRDVRGMVHGFIGSPETAARFFARGWMLSAGKGAMRSPKTKRAFASAPLHQVLVESDEPGENSDVPEVTKWLSQQRGLALRSVAAQIHTNAEVLFTSGR